MNENLRISIAKKSRNTPLGFIRIKKNLNMNDYSDEDMEMYLRKVILSTPLEDIKTQGKNHYFKCVKSNAILTINSRTFTVITAKRITKE